MTYEKTPGIAASPRDWPSGSRVHLATDRATLVIAMHPQCPCTGATVGELNALLTKCQDQVQVYALFYKPKGAAQNWEKTTLWYDTAAIPGVKTLTDEGGTEARRFHASTSGQTFLFNPSGHLLFSGGITAGRGHSGESAGSDAIVSLVNTGKAEHNKTFVFGCSLFTPNSTQGTSR